MSFGEVYGSILKEYPDILTVEEMSNALGVSSRTGYQLLRENKVEHLKVGRAYRVPKVHLLSYLRLNLQTVPDPQICTLDFQDCFFYNKDGQQQKPKGATKRRILFYGSRTSAREERLFLYGFKLSRHNGKKKNQMVSHWSAR